jgi:hypothetical protein
MCQIVSAVVKVDQRNVARLIEVVLDTGEAVAFTFPDLKVPGGRSGLFGRAVPLERLAPSMSEECLFGWASVSGGAS